jgi:predicted RNA-binding protein with PIN domain
VPYLIDGYNLLHALGLIQGRAGPTGLEKARRRLLGLLKGAFADESGALTVVFDAANAPAGASETAEYHGIQVRYAVRQQQADDLIEMLIRTESVPRQLVVVSDDHRLQQAARRRRCPALGCLDFLEELDQRHRRLRPRLAEKEEKRPPLTQEDIQHWLAEFADLEADPRMKELFDPFDFKDLPT